MSSPSQSDLSARVAELEKQVADLRELLERFVSYDEESEEVTLVPEHIRCESFTLFQSWFDENDEAQVQDRISLFVSDDGATAVMRMWNESGEIAYDIEACDEFVGTEHYQGGRLRLASRAEGEWASFDTMHPDGKTKAARIVSDLGSGTVGLRVLRPDATVAASAGIRGDDATVAVWDTEGSYQLVRLRNTGDNLGSIDGWRSSDSRWLQINEIDAGRGGRLCLWTDSEQTNADFFVVADSKICSAGVGLDGSGASAIYLEAGNRVRFMRVNNFLGKYATGIGVDAGGNIESPSE